MNDMLELCAKVRWVPLMLIRWIAMFESKSQMNYVSAATTGVQRNKNIAKLQAGYLFPEVMEGILCIIL